MTGRVAGKAALITGAAGGLGQAMAGMLVREGAKVAVSDRDLNGARATLGAVQSRFEATINTLAGASENTSAARSRIVDADFAVETSQLARQQILQNAATAMVAQANAIPQQVMALLNGL